VITMTKVEVSSNPTQVVKMVFQAPPSVGVWDFGICLKKEYVVGGDDFVNVKLVVVADTKPPIVEVDDIESGDEGEGDDDDDSDVSVEAKVKKVKGEYDDSSDDDDDEGNESDTKSVASDFVE
jgi:hypothetical protein